MHSVKNLKITSESGTVETSSCMNIVNNLEAKHIF